MQADTGSEEIGKVFLSYSRKDRERAAAITAALRSRHYSVTKDTDDILPTEEWRDRLKQLIEEADTIVFLLSPGSAVSDVCAWEVEYAVSLNKRIAPVVIEEVEGAQIPPLLARLNFVFCTPRDAFEDALDTLLFSLNANIDWIREHTRIAGLALRWDMAGRPARLLLRGQDIAEAEAWRDGRPREAPELTPVQAAFIAASRRAAGRRLQGWIAGAVAVSVGAASLAVFAWFQSVEADRQRAGAEASAQAEALSRFRAETRLADALTARGDATAWETLRRSALDYASFAGPQAASLALDGDALRIALSALLSQRTMQADLRPGAGARVLGFSGDSTRVVTFADGTLAVTDAKSGEITASFPGTGGPLWLIPGAGRQFAVILCADAPCLSTASDEDLDDSMIQSYALALAGGSPQLAGQMTDRVWEVYDSAFDAVTHDLMLGKFEIAVFDDAGQAVRRAPLSPCGDGVCIGAGAAEHEIAEGFDLSNRAGLSGRFSPLLAARLLAGVLPSAPVAAFDPVMATDTEHRVGFDLVIRTSYLSAEVEYFLRDDTETWRRRVVCLDFDQEMAACDGGLVGVRLLDATRDHLLVSSANQGTGGGAGRHHTSLIDTETGSVVWQVERVSALGKIAPDGVSFALVDWLGSMELRDLHSHDLIYSHGGRVAENPGSVVFAPRGDLAALIGTDGTLTLLDATAVRDLVMNRAPLRSQRAACRETDDGPFRAVARPAARPLNAWDWQWRTVDSPVLTSPDPAGMARARLDVALTDAGLVLPSHRGGQPLRIARTVLEADSPHRMDRSLPVYAHLSEAEDNAVIWGAEASGEGDGTVWFWLKREADAWSVLRAGRVPSVIAGPAPAAFAIAGPYLAYLETDCAIRVETEDGGSELRVVPAFGNDVELRIDPQAGLLTVISLEWYGAVAMQLFDLRTGAAGPWINIPDDALPGDGLEALQPPPWGNLLRNMVLDR